MLLFPETNEWQLHTAINGVFQISKPTKLGLGLGLGLANPNPNPNNSN